MFKPEYNPVTIEYWSQIKGGDSQPVYQNRDHTDTFLWSINASTTGRDLVSYNQYQSEACNYRSKLLGDNPPPVDQNREPHGYNLVIY